MKDGDKYFMQKQNRYYKLKIFLEKTRAASQLLQKNGLELVNTRANSKKGKKIMDKLKADFEIRASELCISKGSYDVLTKKMEVLEIDETPAYGLETKLKIGINGVVECKSRVAP